MNVIIAENLNGWLFAAMIFFGGIIASLLALGALFPASCGKRSLTFTLAGPAFIAGILITLWFGYGYITDGLHDPDYSPRDFLMPWLFLAGPPLATSLLALLVFWSRNKAHQE